ncbi:hypothetical protein PybrP1_010575 [[Pythium] brassicae (nom. inval.)]|nr:hypothetical protein PybrP1_010575 [[Pythium] brassicae (nom. inval.)]
MRNADSGREVAVTIANLPITSCAASRFVATVRVATNSARNLQLELLFRKDEMRGIVHHSISHQNLRLLSIKSTLKGVARVALRSGPEFA